MVGLFGIADDLLMIVHGNKRYTTKKEGTEGSWILDSSEERNNRNLRNRLWEPTQGAD